MPDYSRLHELAPQVPVPEFEALVGLHSRRTRRTRAVLAASAAVAVAMTVLGANALGGALDNSAPPADTTPTRLPSPTPSQTDAVPPGQQVVRADVRPGDVQGWDTLALITNTQPEHRGATYLEGSATVHTDGASGENDIATYCRGSSDLWLVAQLYSGESYGLTPCSPDADDSLAPTLDIPQWTSRHFAETVTARLYVARPTRTWLEGYDACYRKGMEDCIAVWGVPAPIADPPAEFGFRIYEHRWQRRVLELWAGSSESSDTYEFEALSTLRGTPWLIDRAVLSAPGAGRLVLDLPASDHRRMLSLFTHRTASYDRCVAQHEDELPPAEGARVEREQAVDRLCGNDVRLLVDGEYDPPPAADDLGLDWGMQPMYADPGPHQVVVEVTRGNPDHVQVALLIRNKETS